MKFVSKQLILLFVFLGIFSFGILPLKANSPHRFHTSFTRMDYNETDKLIEISIRLFTHDFEDVFRNQSKTNPLDLENVDELILKYLNEHFVLTDGKDSKLKIVWVGKETKVDTLDIFVEVPFERKFSDLKLKNTIFFKNFRKQINYVSARFGEEKSDLVYKVGDKEKPFK